MIDNTSNRPARSLHPAKTWSSVGRSASLCLLALCMGNTSMAQQPQTQSPKRDRDAPPVVAPIIPGAQHLSTNLQLPGTETTADYILAVVNNEPIVHTDVDKRVARIINSAQPGTQLPPTDVLSQQVLDALIDEKIQLQYGKSVGMAVADEEVDEAIANIAAQNQITLVDLRQRMKADGLDYARYRDSLRDQMILERIRAREVNTRILISEDAVDTYMAQQAAKGLNVDLNLAHILIAVPADASADVVAKLTEKANTLHQQAVVGGNFNQLAKTFSDDNGTRDMGGSLGLRPADRLPEIFVAAVKGLKVGEIAPLLRSNVGFHIVKLVEREDAKLGSYTQQRARHILIRTSQQVSEQQALATIQDIRKQLVDGQASFAELARKYSEDGSATKGGDLGFASPGQFVPEFENALTALQPGEISPPIPTRFGVHLAQLIERREVALTPEQKREAVRSVLREQRFEAAYEEWARELRATAFVDKRDVR